MEHFFVSELQLKIKHLNNSQAGTPGATCEIASGTGQNCPREIFDITGEPTPAVKINSMGAMAVSYYKI